MPDAPVNNTNPDVEDDDDDEEEEAEEGSQVDGIEAPPEVAKPTPPSTEPQVGEMLHRIVLELVEIKTSLAVLHHKFNQTLAGRVMRWFNDRS